MHSVEINKQQGGIRLELLTLLSLTYIKSTSGEMEPIPEVSDSLLITATCFETMNYGTDANSLRCFRSLATHQELYSHRKSRILRELLEEENFTTEELILFQTWALEALSVPLNTSDQAAGLDQSIKSRWKCTWGKYKSGKRSYLHWPEMPRRGQRILKTYAPGLMLSSSSIF